GDVCYWPSLGNGRFGARVAMGSSPWFGDDFDAARVLLTDVDGTGPTDLVHLGAGQVSVHPNACGNRWADAHVLADVPLQVAPETTRTADLFGTGTACLVWSSPYPVDAA